MTLQGPRAEFERALGRSLSRYIGYTSAAYDLDRIFGILSEFVTKPSAYEMEIVHSLQLGTAGGNGSQSGDLTDNYLAEIIHFATSLNLIEVVSDRNAKIKRYAPTQTGRAMMGAEALGDSGFYHFYRTKVVLKADADAMIPVLIFSNQSMTAECRHTEYQRFQQLLRERRWRWLQIAFPEKRLQERILEYLAWAKKRVKPEVSLVIEQLSVNTARHHVTPRSRWLVQLGLTESAEGMITPWGRAVLRALVGDDEYFWLGPPAGVQEYLRIPADCRKGGAREDDVQFVKRANPPSEAAADHLISSTAEMMTKAYNAARLVYAPQAPLELPIEYIAYRSYRDQLSYS